MFETLAKDLFQNYLIGAKNYLFQLYWFLSRFNIMKSIVLSIFFFFSYFGFSQKFELSGGLMHNSFFGGRNEGHATNEYKSGGNCVISLSFEDYLIDTISFPFKFRFEMTYSNYSGFLKTRDGGMGGSSTTSKTVTLNTLSFRISPVNFTIHKHLLINFGAQINFLLSLKENGYTSSWQMYQPSTYNTFDHTIKGNFKDWSIGLTTRIAYEFKLKNKWTLLPQFNFYFDFPPISLSVQTSVKSFRQAFSVGIARSIK